MRHGVRALGFLTLSLIFWSVQASAQVGNAGSIEGVVKDQSGAVVPNATVEIKNPVSGYSRNTPTGTDGSFRFANVPFNPYHLTVTAGNFAPFSQDVEVRSSLPVKVEADLKIGTGATTVNVTENGGDLVENDPTYHTDIDRNLFERTPLESSSSPFSSLVTLTTPEWRPIPTA
jgi:hypothetical protein